MGWVVSKQKDFIGKRSFARADTARSRPQATGRPAAGRPHDPAARGHPARRAGRADLPGDRAGADARPRHLQLPQPGPGPPASPSPSSPTAGDRIGADPARPGGRGPGAGRGDRLRALRPRRDPARWLNLITTDRWPCAQPAGPPCRSGCATAAVTGARGVTPGRAAVPHHGERAGRPRVRRRPTGSRRPWVRRSPAGCGDTAASSAPHGHCGSAPTSGSCLPGARHRPRHVALAAGLDGDPGSVVDVSANRTTLELSGPPAREVLEKGCPLDLHPRAFGPGRAVSTTGGPRPRCCSGRSTTRRRTGSPAVLVRRLPRPLAHRRDEGVRRARRWP